jgi:hypothetical protein
VNRVRAEAIFRRIGKATLKATEDVPDQAKRSKQCPRRSGSCNGSARESANIEDFMGRAVGVLRIALVRGFALSCLALLIGLGPASAQSGDSRAQEQSPKSTAADVAKDGQRKTDEFVEAAKTINGSAGNPECVWLGRRVVSLMWRDDLDTAFRHLDLYDRFGCPGGHVQATFRCLVRFGGSIDPKVAETLNGRVHACWINPNAQPQGVTVPVLPAPVPATPAPPAK